MATVRNNNIYVMGDGYSVTFVDQMTMLFGDKEGLQAALDVKDGLGTILLANNDLINRLDSADTQALWSLSDQKARLIIRSMMYDAGCPKNNDMVSNWLQYLRYSMDFRNCVTF